MKILLPVDGSQAALAAVQHTLGLIEAGLEAELVLVNVQEPPSLYEVMVMHDPAVLDDVRAAAGVDLLQPAEVLLEAAGRPYESEVASGDPAHLLVDLVERYGCTAVVMGANGAGAASTGLGKVTQAVLERSPVPVTVVRMPAVEDEVQEASDPDDEEASGSAAGGGSSASTPEGFHEP